MIMIQKLLVAGESREILFMADTENRGCGEPGIKPLWEAPAHIALGRGKLTLGMGHCARRLCDGVIVYLSDPEGLIDEMEDIEEVDLE